MVFHGLSISSMYFACISQVRCAPKNPEHVSHMSESVGPGCTATCFQINEINSWRSCPITVTIMVLIARPWHCENEIQLKNCKKFASPFKSYRFILIHSSLRTVTAPHQYLANRTLQKETEFTNNCPRTSDGAQHCSTFKTKIYLSPAIAQGRVNCSEILQIDFKLWFPDISCRTSHNLRLVRLGTLSFAARNALHCAMPVIPKRHKAWK